MPLGERRDEAARSRAAAEHQVDDRTPGQASCCRRPSDNTGLVVDGETRVLDPRGEAVGALLRLVEWWGLVPVVVVHVEVTDDEEGQRGVQGGHVVDAGQDRVQVQVGPRGHAARWQVDDGQQEGRQLVGLYHVPRDGRGVGGVGRGGVAGEEEVVLCEGQHGAGDVVVDGDAASSRPYGGHRGGRGRVRGSSRGCRVASPLSPLPRRRRGGAWWGSGGCPCLRAPAIGLGGRRAWTGR